MEFVSSKQDNKKKNKKGDSEEDEEEEEEEEEEEVNMKRFNFSIEKGSAFTAEIEKLQFPCECLIKFEKQNRQN